MIDKKKIGKKLAKLRGNRTQKEVADALGISPSAVTMYETGRRTPIDEMKVKIANYYKRSVQFIFFSD